MSTPTTNSTGNLVWKPQVGLYAKVADNQRESYGGIIGALQDSAVQAGFDTKAYPHNFAGIIAAIQDLNVSANPPPVLPGPNPGNGQINPDTGEWEQVVESKEGDLWFDTRQGRLFVYLDNEWIQTNGADGLAIITDSDVPPATESNPALGQFWYNQDDNQLYIHDGNYVDADGNIVPITDPDARPLWRLVNAESDSSAQTTATLPLALSLRNLLQPRSTDIIQLPDLENFNTQQDYNVWSYDNLLLLEDAIQNKSDIVISDETPTEVRNGLLWYDTSSLDLSVYYIDEDGDGQWVPTAAPYTYDAELDDVRASVINESIERQNAIANVLDVVNNLDFANNDTVELIQNSLSALQNEANSIASGSYQTSPSITAALSQLDSKIEGIVIPPSPDLSPYATKALVNELETQVAALPTQANLNELAQAIPNVDSFVVQQDIDTAIENITVDYLPRNGGTLSGSFVIDKTDYSNPAFDFSSSVANSRNVFKFQSLSNTSGNYITYGTTNSFWEQAWQFGAEEDFCWIYNDDSKVFSITKDGPACSQLYIGDFGNNNDNGRVIHNKIDVRDRLTAYQSAFEQMRQAVNSSTDYDSLKAGLITALANV